MALFSVLGFTFGSKIEYSKVEKRREEIAFPAVKKSAPVYDSKL